MFSLYVQSICSVYMFVQSICSVNMFVQSIERWLGLAFVDHFVDHVVDMKSVEEGTDEKW